MSIPDDCNVFLVCEGGWDVAFLNAILERLRLERVTVFAIEGKSNFRERYINNIIKHPNFPNLQSFGIILDANGDQTDSVNQTLTQINQVLRVCFGTGNNFIKHGEVKPLKSKEFSPMSIGAFIMPDGSNLGSLEDLLLKATKKSHPEIMNCADQFLNCVKSASNSKMKKISKKSMQAFYAGLSEHCPDLNVALRHKHIDPDDDAFADLRRFLQALSAT